MVMMMKLKDRARSWIAGTAPSDALARATKCAFAACVGFASSALVAFLADADVLFGYDESGRLVQIINEAGEARSYRYDAVGNLLSIQDGTLCPPEPPSIERARPTACVAGTTCRVIVEGANLFGGGMSSSVDRATFLGCSAQGCEHLECDLRLAFPGPAAVEGNVITGFGTAPLPSIAVLEPPALSAPGEGQLWRFAGNRGASVTITMSRLANVANGTSTLDPVMDVLDSRGFVVAHDDESGSSLPPGPGRNAVIADLTLPATDVYTIVARGVGGTKGPYLLTIEPAQIALVLVQPPVPGAPAFVFSGGLALGQEAEHAFPAAVGTTATIDVVRVANQGDGTSTLDPAVELLDSRGFVIASDDDGGTNSPPGPGRNAKISAIRLPATDTYRIRVKAAGGTAGPYEVRVFLQD